MKTRLLWISDFIDTGYSSASRLLLNFIIESKSIDVFYYAINHNFTLEQVKEIYPKFFPLLSYDNIFSIENVNIDNSLYKKNYKIQNLYLEQKIGILQLEKVLKTVKPDIIVSINDNGILEKQSQIIEKFKASIKEKLIFISYIPIDCYNLPKGFFERIICNQIWTMTNFGKNVIEKTGYNGVIKILPHAIDIESFRKIEITKKDLRLKWLPERFVDRFIILNSNKNQTRKRLDITLKIFSEISKIHDNVVLILKTGIKPSLNDGGIDLLEEVNKLGDIRGNIIIIDKSLLLEELNELYNLVDVNINTSIGEGWGIIPCEVALCEIPQLVPNHTSYSEIFPKECLVESKEKLRIERDGKINVDIDSVQCICKGYFNTLTKKVSFYSNLLIENMQTYLLSSESSNIVEEFNGTLNDNIRINYTTNNWDSLIEFLNNNRPLYFQVICKNGKNFNELSKYLIKNYRNLDLLYDLEILEVDIESLKVLIKEPIVESFVNRLDNLIRNPDLAFELGKKCRSAIFNNFNINRVGQSLLNILSLSTL